MGPCSRVLRGMTISARMESQQMAAARASFTLDEAATIAAQLGIDFATVPFTLEEYRSGMDVELEHGRRDPDTNVTGDDPIATGKIALAHLRELPDYYTRLAKMETDAGS
jgi:hypothetical protein